MKVFGLIGRTLKHSFSKKYFTDKFEKDSLSNIQYHLFELEEINEFPQLISKFNSNLKGLNVTIPYKKEVMSYLDELDENARIIEAVNTITISPTGKLKGYNTDYIGFKNALCEWDLSNKKALILGTGGASNAVKKVLFDLGIEFLMISRSNTESTITYDELKKNQDLMRSHQLIINTTPVGTFPAIDDKPDLPYTHMSQDHLLFDLVYNPEITAFLQKGLDCGAKVKNGYDMLVGQAEASWEIWNK